jgi:hypothetical protein
MLIALGACDGFQRLLKRSRWLQRFRRLRTQSLGPILAVLTLTLASLKCIGGVELGKAYRMPKLSPTMNHRLWPSDRRLAIFVPPRAGDAQRRISCCQEAQSAECSADRYVKIPTPTGIATSLHQLLANEH